MVAPLDSDMELKPKDYVGQPINCRQGQTFKPWGRTGFTCLEVLPFLKGKPWDGVALGYVHALRPTHIRVVQDSIQLDSQTWRVTVSLKKDGETIRRIEQEVEVGLPEECAHGAALDEALISGLNSKQVKWHAIPGTTCYDGTGKEPSCYIIDEAGKTHPFPKRT